MYLCKNKLTLEPHCFKNHLTEQVILKKIIKLTSKEYFLLKGNSLLLFTWFEYNPI